LVPPAFLFLLSKPRRQPDFIFKTFQKKCVLKGVLDIANVTAGTVFIFIIISIFRKFVRIQIGLKNQGHSETTVLGENVENQIFFYDEKNVLGAKTSLNSQNQKETKNSNRKSIFEVVGSLDQLIIEGWQKTCLFFTMLITRF
jgi:hypothetical protein